MVAITSPVIFQAFADKQQFKNCYYKAIITQDEDSTHYILLYSIGMGISKEPRRRWILIDLIEHNASEDREEAISVLKTVQALGSMHEILIYVNDVYNTSVKFRDLPLED
jgi:hypothetical protein